MDEVAISNMERIAELAAGLKYYERRKVAHIIDQKFAQASNKTELSVEDAMGLRRLLHLETKK